MRMVILRIVFMAGRMGMYSGGTGIRRCGALRLNGGVDAGFFWIDYPEVVA
jgi:hypothetical protein